MAGRAPHVSKLSCGRFATQMRVASIPSALRRFFLSCAAILWRLHAARKNIAPKRDVGFSHPAPKRDVEFSHLRYCALD
jgi:hypothetical protein